MKKYFLLAILPLLVAACCESGHQDNKSNIIGPQNLKLESDVMTPEVMWALGRVSDIQVSPDKSKILFGVTWYDAKQNKGNRDLYVMNIDGSDRKNITNTDAGEYNAEWKDTANILFMTADANGEMQIFQMKADGSSRMQISTDTGGITGFVLAPDGKNIAYSKELPLKTVQDIYPDLDKANARIIDDLMYRHWDEWVTTTSHLFIAPLKDGKMGTGVDLLNGEPFEVPQKPFGGLEQICWSPDAKTLVYTCRKKTGVEYSLSTNTDLYSYDLESKKTMNLTEGMNGYDWNPVFSPDGKKLAWESMEREGYESDKLRLFVMDIASGEKTEHTRNFDQSAEQLRWSDDGQKIYFMSDWHGTRQIYVLDFYDNSIVTITSGVHDYVAFEPCGDKIIAQRQSMSQPDELYSVDTKTGKAENISMINKDLLAQLTMGKVEERWVKTTDGKDMLTWVIYPPHFDSTKTYPVILYCQGGPQGMVGQFWSYRWNFQMMAANGYIVVAPNRRGVPGFGMEWLEQISGDYGGQNMKDYLSAIDAVSAEPYADENRMAAVGASYGGFSVFWLAGHHEGRFRAFIAHDGMFNLESQYLETEELWFVNWDLGGPYWDKQNTVAQRSYANSPHLFVDKWDTPILIFHGERDYRIAYTQAMQAFTAAKLKGLPARLVLFPEENHWVLKPQNAILWQREFKSWLDTYLK
ncbi:MAG: peptidase S9 [Bacteroidetes bacterium HGW-Bacteroidetes-6]|jgi:dipeptidyl aminopeptidase/acylaminoacyl peptidase|nr:MAG: peptidase S9 [Bacteroidetes bacterium HGW-Bacteroidetes-6]